MLGRRADSRLTRPSPKASPAVASQCSRWDARSSAPAAMTASLSSVTCSPTRLASRPEMMKTGTSAGQGRLLRARRKSLSGRRSIFASPRPSRSPAARSWGRAAGLAKWSRNSSQTRSRAHSEPALGVPTRMTPATRGPLIPGAAGIDVAGGVPGATSTVGAAGATCPEPTGCRQRETKSLATRPPILWPMRTIGGVAGRLGQCSANQSALRSMPWSLG